MLNSSYEQLQALIIVHTSAPKARTALLIAVVERRPASEAAARSGLSQRQVQRLARRFRERLAEAGAMARCG